MRKRETLVNKVSLFLGDFDDQVYFGKSPRPKSPRRTDTLVSKRETLVQQERDFGEQERDFGQQERDFGEPRGRF